MTKQSVVGQELICSCTGLIIITTTTITIIIIIIILKIPSKLELNFNNYQIVSTKELSHLGLTVNSKLSSSKHLVIMFIRGRPKNGSFKKNCN